MLQTAILYKPAAVNMNVTVCIVHCTVYSSCSTYSHSTVKYSIWTSIVQYSMVWSAHPGSSWKDYFLSFKWTTYCTRPTTAFALNAQVPSRFPCICIQYCAEVLYCTFSPCSCTVQTVYRTVLLPCGDMVAYCLAIVLYCIVQYTLIVLYCKVQYIKYWLMEAR